MCSRAPNPLAIDGSYQARLLLLLLVMSLLLVSRTNLRRWHDSCKGSYQFNPLAIARSYRGGLLDSIIGIIIAFSNKFLHIAISLSLKQQHKHAFHGHRFIMHYLFGTWMWLPLSIKTLLSLLPFDTIITCLIMRWSGLDP